MRLTGDVREPSGARKSAWFGHRGHHKMEIEAPIHVSTVVSRTFMSASNPRLLMPFRFRILRGFF